MNKYILSSKIISKNGEFTLIYSPVISYSKDGASGVFISQNNRLSSVVTKDEFDKSVLGQIKSVSYQFN